MLAVGVLLIPDLIGHRNVGLPAEEAFFALPCLHVSMARFQTMSREPLIIIFAIVFTVCDINTHVRGVHRLPFHRPVGVGPTVPASGWVQGDDIWHH